MLKTLVNIYKEMWHLLPSIASMFGVIVLLVGAPLLVLFLALEVSSWFMLLLVLVPVYFIGIFELAGIVSHMLEAAISKQVNRQSGR